MNRISIRQKMAALTAAVCMITTFAGCGGSSDSSSAGKAENSSSVTADSVEVVTLPPKDEDSKPEETASSDESGTESAPADDKFDTSDVPYTPAMWKVTSPSGNTMYMMGSMHALKEECVPLPDYVTERFGESEVLAVECDISDSTKNSAAALAVMNKITYPNGETIGEHLGEDLWEEIASYIEAYGGDPESLKSSQAWYIYSLLESMSLDSLGLDSTIGFDMQLLNMAKEQGKEIFEVESAEMQMDMLSGFDEKLIKAAIKGYSAENKDLIEEKLIEMYTAWKSGDTDSVSTEEGFDEELYTEEDKANIAEFNRILVTDRNVGMADKAMELLDSGKTVFYVVGLAHYLGDGGIIKLLEAEGCTVERVEV